MTAQALGPDVSDGLVEGLRDGWALLLGEGLKRYAEGPRQPLDDAGLCVGSAYRRSGPRPSWIR